MAERRFHIVVGGGCLREEAMGVMVRGTDARWRYWLEVGDRIVAGNGDFPPTRAGHASLKRAASAQLADVLWPPRRAGAPEDVQ